MTNPLEYFLHWEKNSPTDIVFRQAKGAEWITWTFTQAGDEIRRIAGFLDSLNLPPHSKIGILSKNCPHWVMADLAIMMSGHVSVPLYPTLPGESIHEILTHSEARVLFIGKLDHFASQQSGIPSLVQIGVDAYGIHVQNTWEKIIANQLPIATPATILAEDLMTIVYTSGTTGKPKGVMHAFHSFHTTLSAARQAIPFPLRPRLFSYLPMSHIAERLGIETMGLMLGAQFSFAENLDTFARNLADTQPDYFFAVPRIWSKFQEKILEKFPEPRFRRLISLPLVGGLLKSVLKKKLGLSKARLFFSGAAPLSKSQLEWWQRLGITILEVYGMTEDCVYSHFNAPDAYRFSTVGRPLPGLKRKIADLEEICVKSDCLMKGYYKEPEMTAAMFDEEGYLKTGDTGSIDQDGYLTIIGRVKDQFKTDKGKYISPAPIEMKLMANKDIAQVCVVGMGIPQPIALTVLNETARAKSKEDITASLTATMDAINEHLESYEKLETAVVMRNEWTQENGLLTPTLKLKRNALEKIYVPRYPGWYHEKGRVVWE